MREKIKTKRQRSPTHNPMTEDIWLYHILHLSSGIFFEHRCRVCKLKCNEALIKERSFDPRLAESARDYNNAIQSKKLKVMMP